MCLPIRKTLKTPHTPRAHVRVCAHTHTHTHTQQAGNTEIVNRKAIFRSGSNSKI